jgi:hypothetical protein
MLDEETQRRLDELKAWMRSEEGIAAMAKAREEANKTIEELNRPAAKCTCCPVHGSIR